MEKKKLQSVSIAALIVSILPLAALTIRRALRDLVREGFLIIEERQRESGGDSSLNNYRLIFV